MKYRYFGKLYLFFETGTEGIIWALNKKSSDENTSYEDIVYLRDGDLLEVYDDNANLFWRGHIDLEYQTNWYQYPFNPSSGQQAVNGMWVNGLQRDVDPEFWMLMFSNSMNAKVVREKE